ncbi:MAG: hypothetical protein KDC53_05940 [Saprospiraceae bacterium]|nr:hypothetical protein [Saprospiraceae bacterium]
MGITKFLCFLFVLLLLPKQIVSQIDTDFKSIDQWSTKQILKDTGLVAFTEHLIEPGRNEAERLRAIFTFIAHFLEYDNSSAHPGAKRKNQNIYDILRNKKGICWDYAQLLNKMSQIAGIECITVVGFSRDIEAARPVARQPDHAWNLVRIDSEYYLLDVTWASNTKSRPDAFQRLFATDYFLTNPELFIKNHFPAIPAFQLLDCPIAFEAFEYNEVPPSSSNCKFNFRDSIDSYKSLSYLDQKIKEAHSVYISLPNEKNNRIWGHAILDKALDLKENGDFHFEKGDHQEAKVKYDQALVLFADGEKRTDLFPWQKEAKGFCLLNYAQILYRLHYQSDQSFDIVIYNLKQARDVLASLHSSSISIQSALQQIDHQISVLE